MKNVLIGTFIAMIAAFSVFAGPKCEEARDHINNKVFNSKIYRNKIKTNIKNQGLVDLINWTLTQIEHGFMTEDDCEKYLKEIKIEWHAALLDMEGSVD
jgi:hypothetical protein